MKQNDDVYETITTKIKSKQSQISEQFKNVE